MALVKNKNTKPEILVRKALFREGFRYRINDKKLPGSPDIVLPKHNTVIFVHGCYWHGHENCKKQITPKTNKSFWNEKIEKNKTRDRKVQNQLRELGWNILIVWECELRNKEIFTAAIEELIKDIRK